MSTNFGQFTASASPLLTQYAVGFATAVTGGERRWLWSDVRTLMQANLAAVATSGLKADVGLGNVENTALSTWAGSTNLTTLGTIASGVWSGTAIADAKIASALTGKTYNALTLTATAVGFTIAGGTSSKTLTVALDANVSGTNTGDQTISITGDGTASGSTGALTLAVTKLNGTSLAGLATGILKNTTTTGVPSIAVAGDFPTLNQNTTGSAASLSATLVATSGGTGISSYAVGDLLYASTTTALSKLAAVATGQVLISAGAGTAPAWSASPTLTGISLSGNLTFTGTGNRITGDMSNATAANRVLLQTSTANSTTATGLIPSGSGSQTNWILYAGSDPANTNFLNIKANTSETMLDTNAAGTGTTQTMNLKVAGTTVLALSAALAAITGALTVSTTLTVNSIPVTGNIPQNSQSTAYTTVLTDANKHIYHPGADTTARTWTIDSNANVAYPIGTTLTFVNDTSGGAITIAITTDTLVLAGAGTTGSRTLAANGIATAIKMTSTRWQINGTGLT